MYISGTPESEILNGTVGNDHLDGGGGDDLLLGGAGDDYYIIDSSGDTIFELAGQGSDTVAASIDFTLGSNVENLFLTGNAISGTGNSGNNFLVANQGLGSQLDGQGGNDLLIGGAGDDLLLGGTGNDDLRGGAGNNDLRGGAGDDYYVIDNSGDTIFELAGQGSDTVVASVDFTLGNNVENLYLSGSATRGTGSDGNNFLVANQTVGSELDGGAGNDLLIGGAGNDLLLGGAGNDDLRGGAGNNELLGGAGDDYYVVDSSGDTVFELAGQGSDTVAASVDFTLANNVENLYLSGNATRGTGNNGNNFLVANQALGSELNGRGGNDLLIGGAGNDLLFGGAGNDELVGGTGSDSFYFGDISVGSFANIGVDLIRDFTSGVDSFYLDDAVFLGLTTIDFAIVTSDTDASTLGSNIIYNSSNGNLFYNQDGATGGFGNGGQFATLVGTPTIAATDFVII